MRAWKMRLEQSGPGGREGNIIELTLLLAFSEDRLGEQLYTFSDVSSIYREIQVVLWFLCRISAIFGLNAKRPSNKQLSFAFSHWNPDSWAQNKHPLLNGNHVLAPIGRSFAKEKVPFSQINISQRISGVFFREKKTDFDIFSPFAQNVKTAASL